MFKKIKLTSRKQLTAFISLAIITTLPMSAISQTSSKYNVAGVINNSNSEVTVVNNFSGKSVKVNRSGGFTFTQIEAGTPYEISFQTEKYQKCEFDANSTSTSGTVNGHIGGIKINCTPEKYTVSGRINLPETIVSDDITITDKKGNTAEVNKSNPTFSFSNYEYPDKYEVGITHYPAHYKCSTSVKSGQIKGNVANLVFECKEERYPLSLVVRRLTDKLVITSRRFGDKTSTLNKPSIGFNGYIYGEVPELVIPLDYKDAATDRDNQPYQVCEFTEAFSAIKEPATAEILCTDKLFYVSGKATNLKGTIVITNKTKEDDSKDVKGKGIKKVITLNPQNIEYRFDGYTFPNSYALRVTNQPKHQECQFSQAEGTFDISQRNNKNIAYNKGNIEGNELKCVDKQYTIQGTVEGYNGKGLQIADEGRDTYDVTNKSKFIFENYIAGDSYSLTVYKQPKDQTCRVIKNNKGVIEGNIKSIVKCENNQPEYGFDAGIEKGVHLKVPLNITSKTVGKEICEGTVEWGDGNIEHIKSCATKFSFTHEYTQEDTFLVRVKVTKPEDMKGEMTINVPVRKSKQCVVPGPNGTTIDGFMDGFEAVIP